MPIVSVYCKCLLQVSVLSVDCKCLLQVSIASVYCKCLLQVSIASVYCRCPLEVSLIRFIDLIHWFDSLSRFIESIHWVDSLIRFICKCLASIVVYLKLASGWKISKKHEKEAERYVNGPQAENVKCKVVIFSREKFSWLHFCCVNFDFSENPRWILKQPLRSRAGRPVWPLHALCVFLCTPSLIAKWEPLEVNFC